MGTGRPPGGASAPDCPFGEPLGAARRPGGGRAVAVAHAHPGVLAAAADVTGSNDAGGHAR